MTEIYEFITSYGLESVVLALIINFSTGLIKLPVKALANKMKNGAYVTRFLVFMPVALGFAFTLLYTYFKFKTILFDEAFYSLWLSSSSLSLTFYAIFEKMFPSKRKVLKDYELQANKLLIEEIKAFLTKREEEGVTGEMPYEVSAVADTCLTEKTSYMQDAAAGADTGGTDRRRRFVLGVKKDEKTQVEE